MDTISNNNGRSVNNKEGEIQIEDPAQDEELGKANPIENSIHQEDNIKQKEEAKDSKNETVPPNDLKKEANGIEEDLSNIEITEDSLKVKKATLELDDCLEKIYKKVSEGVDEKSQKHLAKLVSLSGFVRQSDEVYLQSLFKVAALSLVGTKLNLTLADNAISKIIAEQEHYGFKNNNVFSYKSPVVKVVLGLSLLLYCALPLSFLLVHYLADATHIFGIEIKVFNLLVFFGALGSIISIMVRIQDFNILENVDSAILFLTGFFKPIIGTGFALFVYATIQAGIIPITITQGKELYFYMALAFLSGFSERFARDVATNAEKVVVVGDKLISEKEIKEKDKKVKEEPK